MKKVWILPVLIFLLVVAAAWLTLPPTMETQTGFLARPQTFLHKVLTTSPQPQPEPSAHSLDISSWLKHEGTLVGQIDSHPQDTKIRLESKAHSLEESELKSLHKVIENRALNTDERFLAVYLLSLNQSPSAINYLEQISALPIESATNDRQYSDELIIRMQALEALVKALPPVKAKEYLSQYLKKQSNPSLANHARLLL